VAHAGGSMGTLARVGAGTTPPPEGPNLAKGQILVVYLRSADKYRRLPLDRHKDETASRKGLSFITAAPPCPDALDISRAYTACRIDAVSSIASCGSPDCADIASSGLLSFPCWIERPI
jgi:hypothetical protein